jgi:tRNA threonylcarbamoyl adenosine modification protein YeaZ/ribosomal-protein-alanine acetyltransferase
MRILAVDTSTTAATAAIMEDGRLTAETILNISRAHSQRIMGLIDELFKKSGLTPSDIDVFACSAGPGSFTGLRIGASVIKGMAQVARKPVVAVPTLDALAYNLFNCSGFVCPILDAQRGMVYSNIYSWDKGLLIKNSEFGVIHIDELIMLIKEKAIHTTFLGDAVELHKDRLEEGLSYYSIAPSDQLLPRAASCAALAIDLFNKGKFDSYDSLRLTYIRKSQAEVEYDEKHKTEFVEMKKEDLNRVLEIERLSFLTPWSRESFEDELEKNKLAKYVVAKVDGITAGYGGMWIILDEGHITNIAVHPDYRGWKLGERITQALLKIAEENNVKRVTLEVRASNDTARNMYKKLGFIDNGIRKGYYSDSGEDAIIMWKELN